MEKDIGRIPKNPDTDIVVRIDDFGGKTGLTIREFVNSEGYKGFTKAGVRIRAENFDEFKRMINSISAKDLQQAEQSTPLKSHSQKRLQKPEDDENSGIDEDGTM